MQISRINAKNSMTYASINNVKTVKCDNENKSSKENSGILKYTQIPSFAFMGHTKSFDPLDRLKLTPVAAIDRTSPEAFVAINLIDENSDAYLSLEEDDKEALAHLVKAVRVLDDVFLKQDNPHNLEFRDYLLELKNMDCIGAKETYRLFDAQKGVNGHDNNGDLVSLDKNSEMLPQRGFYPEDLSEEEFREIISKMLDKGEINKVKNVLSQSSMVERDGDELKGVDYSEYFREEFETAANELRLAGISSTNKEFAEFCFAQADALESDDPMLSAQAEMQWAKLQDTPLEFTISKESYYDDFTSCVLDDPELAERLRENGIKPLPKDVIGARAGIVNKEGTEMLLKTREALPLMAALMPYNDRYKQTIKEAKDLKQTMVDVDLVAMSGDYERYRGCIILAQNLPNCDKLSIGLGGGRRNVYHRQIRMQNNDDSEGKLARKILDPEQMKYYKPDAIHKFTVLHENLHSLGPKTTIETLGNCRTILEENKADIGAVVMLDELTKLGFYTEDEQKEILTSFILRGVPKTFDLSNAHKQRALMQHYYLFKEGAFTINDKGVIKIDYDKVTEASRKMLDEIILTQLSGDINLAKEYTDKYTVWADEFSSTASIIQNSLKSLNAYVNQPFADKIMAE